MINPNRKKVTFKFSTPIVYKADGTPEGIVQIDEFVLYKPLAGQIKKLGKIDDLDYAQMIALAADCSEMTVEMLDLMDFYDLNRLCKAVTDFLSHGEESAD